MTSLKEFVDQLESANRFIKNILDSLADTEDVYGVVFEFKDIKKLLFKNLKPYSDTGLSTFDKAVQKLALAKSIKEIDACVWDLIFEDIKVKGFEIQFVCCNHKELVLGPRECSLKGLVDLENVKNQLVKEGRLSERVRLDVLRKECRCT